MITAYHRPKSLPEALILLSQPDTFPLGGGTLLNQKKDADFAVVDLQALGLDKIHKVGEKLEIGAAVTLQALLESPHTPAALKAAIKLEAPLNLRNMGTVAGTLVSCDGRSPFAAVMLALDAKLTVVSGELAVVNLGDFLPLRVGAGLVPARGGRAQGSPLQSKLITKIEIPLNAKSAYESVARTPADRPIVCAALAQWPSGRTRLVVGGWGRAPSVAMDGNGTSGIEAAARNAAHEAADEWASAEYRSEVAAVLAKRCLEANKW